MKTPRIYRKARDRAISIALALFIGVVFGVGGWLIINRNDFSKTPDARVPGKIAEAPVNTPTKGVQILPHKALYAIKLTSAKNGSQIINIGGRMYYQLQHGCDSWITDHRFALNYEYADTAPMRITSDFSTVEAADGKSFNFTSRRRRDGEMYQELRGKAQFGATGAGQAAYEQPKDLNFDLSVGTMFPTAHTKALLDAARKGKKFLSAVVFDGTDEEGPVQITAVIGDKTYLKDLPDMPKAVDPALLKVPAWKVTLAFFPLNEDNDSADYQLTMWLHENGIISDMTIDYQDFSVEQTLSALAALPLDECGAAQAGPVVTATPGGPKALTTPDPRVLPTPAAPKAVPPPDLPVR